jgi:penicillin-binding protein 1A
VTLTQALALSLNTVAVRLGVEVGPKAIAEVARRLGVHSELAVNASLALGTSEVSPLELVTAYAPFANGGLRVQPHVITQVRTASGKVLYRRKGTSFGRVVDSRHIGMMNTMMQETLLTGTARRADIRGWQAAGKTGTSQEHRDGWFVGYTSHLVAGVWLGNDDSSPGKRLSGGNLPVEVWTRFMQEAHALAPPQPLETGGWRNAPPPPPMQESWPAETPMSGMTPPPRQSPASAPPNPPMNLGGAAPDARTRNVSARAPGDNRSLLPPANVGESRGRGREPERGFLDRLFGG